MVESVFVTESKNTPILYEERGGSSFILVINLRVERNLQLILG
jgi:hypothetical protein